MFICGSILFGGCGPGEGERAAKGARNAFYAGDYNRAAMDLQKHAEKTDENFALQNARLGSALLAAYRLDEAEAAFTKSYEVMNSVGTNSGGRSLGAVLIDEKIRIWKGEPFERAMVDFYLGLIYYMRADYNNARAAFEQATSRLSDYDDDGKKKRGEVQSDFVLASIMLGRCWQKLGREDLANAQFAYAAQVRPDLAGPGGSADPEINRRANVLLVVDAGYGPRRQTNWDNSTFAFTPTPGMVGPVPAVGVLVDGQPYGVGASGTGTLDLLAIAQDRKWQSIDTIRATKSMVGTGLLAGGAVMGAKGLGEHGGRQSTDLMVAGGLALAGLALKATSQADVREWGMLPRTVYVLPLQLTPGPHQIQVQLTDGVGQTWVGIPAPAQGQEATYYFRLQRFLTGPYQWPPPALGQNVRGSIEGR